MKTKMLLLALFLCLPASAQTLAIWQDDPRWPGAIMVRVTQGDPTMLYQVKESFDFKAWNDIARMPVGQDWILEMTPRYNHHWFRAEPLGSIYVLNWEPPLLF